MAAAGKGLATLIEVNGYDQYRIYSEEPQAGSWRELRNPIGGQRYWHHVGARLTTWSLVELLRLNGLEEFLLVGEWGVFAVVPEDVKTYEDLEWALPIYDNDRLSGVPLDRITRGSIVVSLGFPRQGILELMLPCDEKVVKTVYAPMRSGGKRLVQRLPVRMHNEDLVGMAAITVPLFCVRPDAEAERAGKGDSSALVVTAERDPRSPELGHVKAGSIVGLAAIVGTRAQLARVKDGPRNIWGGWISLLLLDGTSTLERVMEETENMKLADQLKAHLAEVEALRAAAVANGEDPDEIQLPPKPGEEEEEVEEVAAVSRSTKEPPIRSKAMLEYGLVQRMTVSGGWRQVLDKVWWRPVYVEPLAGRMTWGFVEVVKSGGLDDLLLARQWELCVVDPLSVEDQKDKTYCLKVFSDPSLSGQPIMLLPKGAFVIVQVFHKYSQIAMLLLPPAAPGADPAIGYAFYQKRDGRSILRALLPQGELDSGTGQGQQPENMVTQEMLGYCEPPEGPILEGPYYAEPPDGTLELAVSTGQDLESDRWARLPRGYCVREFAEILGFRARLPDLEGGGWVNLVSPEGKPCFRKQPLIPSAIELPAQELDKQEANLPIVWPHFGVLRPLKPVLVKPHVPAELPALLQRLGGGRALCDWTRKPLPLFGGGHVWRNPLTGQQSSLDALLRSDIWKIAVVQAATLSLRERAEPSAEVLTLRRGTIVVCEWVSTGSVARLLLPGKPMDETPRHLWTDLAGPSGATLAPLPAGGVNFWMEPRGGHLPEEEQADPSEKDQRQLTARKEKDGESASSGYFQRGDGIQVAEVSGRFARVVHTKCILAFDACPSGGWIDLFDESGWSIVRMRYPGVIHPVEQGRIDFAELQERIEAETRKEVEQERLLRGTMFAEQSSDPKTASAEDGDVTEMTSEGAFSELPSLLWQLGELEVKSIWTRDWREHIEPIWGQRYYVNRWSGQIIHRLTNFGVACPAVRLTVWFSNISFNGIRQDAETEEEAELRMSNVEKCLLPSFAAMADVDEDRVSLKVSEGPGRASKLQVASRSKSVSGDKHRDDGNGELLEVELGGLQAPPTAKPSGIHQAGACLAIRVLRRVEEEEAKAQPTTPEDDIADGGLPHRSVSSNRINTSGLTKNLEEETLAYTAESACTLDDAQWARRGAASCYSAPPVMMQPKLLEFVRTATIAECDADGDCLPPSAIVWVEGALDPTMLSNVKVGQRVLCFDRLSRGTKYAEVTDVRTFDAQHSDWVRVVLEDDTELMMTADHPLFPEVGEAGAKEADSGLVKAGDLVVGKHSLEVLKMVPVPVKEVIGLERDAEGAAEKQPPSKRVALSVQQGDRHSVYVAHKEGGVGMAVGSASISVDQVATRLRDSISIKNTFIELLDEGSDEEQMPLRRRTYSAPVDLELYRFSCAEEDDTNSVAASSIGRQKGLRRSYSRVSCASSKISAASSWLTSKCSSVSASSGPVHRQIILGNQPKDRDFTAGSGPGIEERTGVAELSAALAAKQAGLRSIGSLNHCQGHCYPCLMETWFHNGKSTQGCKFGLFCGRCHEPHSEAEVRKMRKNAKKPQGRGK